VGRIYLDHLSACEKYDGRLCLKVLGRNKKLWEKEVRDITQNDYSIHFVNNSYLQLRSNS